jgi:hypothetical protein
MKYTITSQFPESLTTAQDVRGNFKRHQEREVRPVFQAMMSDVQEQTPYDSIRSGYSMEEEDGGDSYTVSLRNSVPHWIFREEDTRPHWPPWGPGSDLARWSEERGIPAFLVARKISRVGTLGNHIVRDVWADYKDDVIQAQTRAAYAWARAWGADE